MTFITIFTVPKSFTGNAHIRMIQRNTAQNLAHLGPDVDPILIGDDDGVAETAQEFGIRHLPNIERTPQGTPLVSSAFMLARENSSSPLLACINADNLLLPDFIETARVVFEQEKKFLLVGERFELDITEPLEFGEDWPDHVRREIASRSRPLGPSAVEYMIFPRDCFKDMPPFAFGRSGWDNWMAYKARKDHLPLIDATGSILLGHQNHDYSHLPGNKPPYKLPESLNNVRMSGGPRAMFGIGDATHVLEDGRVRRYPLRWKKFWREVEIFPLVTLKSFFLAEIFFAVLHPERAIYEWRTRLSKLKSQILASREYQ
jgi:hypothetical protein